MNFDILHRCKKSVQIFICGGEVGSYDEVKLRDNQTLKRDNKEVVSKDDGHASIKARPDINEISKRNEI